MTRRLPRGWRWRGALLFLPLVLAMIAFRGGVGTTTGALDGVGGLGQLYYAIGLFVLGGLDLGTPEGGPRLLRAGLWFAYFLAPVITTGAVAEGILRSVQPRWMHARGLRDHIVLVGLGSIGMLYLESLRAVDPRRQVLVMDLDAGRPNVVEARDMEGVRFVQGDITHRAARAGLRLDRAAGVVLMTKADLLNLEAAWELLDDDPSNTPIIVHVADIAMRRRLGRLADGERRVRAFNSHRIAARRLWKGYLAARFEETSGEDAVVIAGFGRFGQTILEYIRDKAGSGLGRVVVVDRDASLKWEHFSEQFGDAGDRDCIPVDGDLDDPRTWEAVTEALGELTTPPSFVLGVDSDRTNLRCAVRLRATWPDAAVFARCFHESRFTDEMAAEFQFQVLPLERLLREAFREEHLRWFGRKRSLPGKS